MRMRNSYKDLDRNLKKRDNFGDLGADGRIMLRQILKK
jgi:hypothetical protein